MLVVGDKEMENNQVALRMRSGENPGAIDLAAFIELANQQVAEGI
jgi:threonyl-tRNA synthetase